ncbi:DUF748 domain-containing protein [Aestuariibacter sp. A3R04]|uniref:DUF748 domain-containing protein n=1 Tax=Aestuariibacter sp. A3R04 TaxID=2841571 RepID=UPI001C0A38E5|nr:DUF748 domain-containing protein [Aestuariibacter sp. A3R04]MBU3020332.1 DUF748 domain-containing protein [Aestuariibacter sp. A3R04]
MNGKTLTVYKLALFTLAFIFLLRLILPFAVQWYINDTLDNGRTYTGSVGDVDIMLWRGAYRVEDIFIFKRSGEIEQPFFSAKKVDISVLWSAIMDRTVVATVLVTAPSINVVDGTSTSRSQSGENENWLYLADQLMPLKVDQLTVQRGAVRFLNPSAGVDVSLHHLDATAINLVNSRDLSKNLVATLNATGKTTQQGTLILTASLNPATPLPTFDINLQVSDVALVNFKSLLDTYAPFDLEAGHLEMAMELACDNGTIEGYAKPILHNVDVFSWKGDIERDDDGIVRGMTEALSGFVAELFENQEKDQIATRIPISGSLDDVNTPVLSALGGILRNAFIKAINSDLEDSVEWEDINKTEPSTQAKKDDLATKH